MRHYTDADVDRVLARAPLEERLRRAFVALAEGRAAQQPRMRTDAGGVKLSTLGGVIPDLGVVGAKVYTTIAGRFNFIIALFSTKTGEPLATFEANAITKWRTAAVSVLASRVGATQKPRAIAVFGTGVQGKSHADAFERAYPGAPIRIVARRMSAEDVKSALEGADIIATATRSTTPLFDGGLVSKGAFIAAVGSSRPDTRELLRRSLAALSPGYFGLAMATGIVSIAAGQLGLHGIARALLFLNAGFYALLWVLNILRFAWHRQAMASDAMDHARAPGFFTWVAATSVLGAQCISIAHDGRVAWALWAAALALWLFFTYAIFAALTVKEHKPPLERGINGAWLLAVVATQSIAVLSALLAVNEVAEMKRALNFLALSTWLCGGMLYAWIMGLIFYRYTFFRLSAEELTPPYWINMGAMAISTLAGSLLIVNSAEAPLLSSLLPFLRGFTIFYWATGTWWIPMLLVLGFWRYVWHRYPLRYNSVYWAAVFPLGMYAAATHEMVRALDLAFLDWIPQVFFYVAVVAWTAAMAGLVIALASRGNLAALPREGR